MGESCGAGEGFAEAFMQLGQSAGGLAVRTDEIGVVSEEDDGLVEDLGRGVEASAEGLYRRVHLAGPGDDGFRPGWVSSHGVKQTFDAGEGGS